MPPALQLELVTKHLQTVAHHAGMTCTDPAVVRRLAKVGVADLQQSPVAIRLDDVLLTFGRPELFNRLVGQKVFLPQEGSTACQFDAALEAVTRARFAEALALIDSLPGAAGTIFRAVISEVACFQVSRPEMGTISSDIGLIYANPKLSWTAEGFAENLFHEAAHTVLYLIDMTQGLMPDAELLDRAENRCYSAVRHEPRGFFSAFHAAFVVSWLMWFQHQRTRCGGPERTRENAELRSHGLRAVNELKGVAARNAVTGRPICTEVGQRLLDELAAFFHSADYDDLVSSPATLAAI